MKFFSVPKQKGTTLVISLLVSFLVLGLAMTVLESVGRTIEQAQNLQRGDQVFYAAESGIEAAFFHHNVRGQGVDFGSLDQEPFPDSMKIAHLASNTNVQWTIDGRAEPEPGIPAEISGTLHRDEYIQLPLFWDNAVTPGDPEGQVALDDNKFKLVVNEPADIKFTFEQLTNKSISDPLIAWGLVRDSETEGVQTLVPVVDGDDPCGINATFICDGDSFPETLKYDDTRSGQVLPTPAVGSNEMSWSQFLSDSASDSYSLTLQALGTFKRENPDGDGNEMAIPGVPFRVVSQNPDAEIPRQEFEVSARVQQGNFEKTIHTTVRERTAAGVFNYVTFD